VRGWGCAATKIEEKRNAVLRRGVALLAERFAGGAVGMGAHAMGSRADGMMCVWSAESSVLVMRIGVFMLRGVMLLSGTVEVDGPVGGGIVKVDGSLILMHDIKCKQFGIVDVDNVVDSNASRVPVDTAKLIVVLGHIAMPSMMQGSSGDGHASEESVGDNASVDGDDSSTVCVTVTTTVLIVWAAVASVMASLCGEAMMLGSSVSRAKVKQQGVCIVELNLGFGGREG
jgi:hypothetical protein